MFLWPYNTIISICGILPPWLLHLTHIVGKDPSQQPFYLFFTQVYGMETHFLYDFLMTHERKLACFPWDTYSPIYSHFYPLKAVLWVGGWAPELVQMIWKSEKSWPYWGSNSNHSVVQPVASCYTDWAAVAITVIIFNRNSIYHRATTERWHFDVFVRHSNS
jgi:hypothetical protein